MDKSLKEIVKRLKNFEHTRTHLRHISKLKKEQIKELKTLRKTIDDNLIQIDTLNTSSLRSLYNRIMGHNSNHLELYKQHYLECMLRHNELMKSIEVFDFEIGILNDKISKYPKIVGELKGILKYREKNIPSANLRAFRKYLVKLNHKHELIGEIEEAITEGIKLNKKYNAAIKFVIKKAENIFEKNKEVDEMLNYKVKRIDKYQDHMIRIQHAMVKFEAELHDVYRDLLGIKNLNQSHAAHFLREYKESLLADIQNNKDLESSYQFLKSHKTVIMSLTMALRSDLRSLRKEVTILENQEEGFLAAISRP